MDARKHSTPSRREFLGAAAALAGSLALAGCANQGAEAAEEAEANSLVDAGDEAAPIEVESEELVADPDPEDSFGVDRRVNMATIDQYLHREDVAYRDVRLLDDPADFAAIGGNAELDRTLEGFRIVPFPYMASMPALAVGGAYDGPCLFDVEWADDNRSVVSAQPNYPDAPAILEELFPRHKKLFLMCGGGGYAGMMRVLLIYMGWDAEKVFNIGGSWDYEGPSGVYLVSYDDDGTATYRRWRADYALIEFDKLRTYEEEGGAPEVISDAPVPHPHDKARKCIVL